MPVSRFSAALAAGLCFAAPVSAQSLEACRSIADSAARLACYDLLPATPPDVPLAPAVDVQAAPPPSLLGKAWELDEGTRGRILQLRAYKPVYALPLFYSTRPNTAPLAVAGGSQRQGSASLDNSEAKYQISLKAKLAENLLGDNGDLWFGYTQSSHWQVFNGGMSRPFRETDYEPEAMLLWRTDYNLAGWRGRFVSLGVNHQSNGRGQPLSRSWNRVIAAAAFEKDNWTLTVRPWWRIPERRHDDDNPEIENYVGRADMQLIRLLPGGHQFSVLLRHSLRGGQNSRGSVQFDYAFPLLGDLRGHVQWFSGYGESLIDYNYRANYFGLGMSLLEWY